MNIPYFQTNPYNMCMNFFHLNPSESRRLSQTSQASCLVRWAISRHQAHQASQGEAWRSALRLWTSKEKWLKYVKILCIYIYIYIYMIYMTYPEIGENSNCSWSLFKKKKTDIPDTYQNLDHVGVATKVKYIEQNAHLPEPICMQGMPQPWNSTPPQKNRSGNSHIQFWGFNNLPVASNHQLRPQLSILTSAWKGHFRRHWRHAWPCSNHGCLVWKMLLV